jgi:hypothetical protein
VVKLILLYAEAVCTADAAIDAGAPRIEFAMRRRPAEDACSTTSNFPRNGDEIEQSGAGSLFQDQVDRRSALFLKASAGSPFFSRTRLMKRRKR